MVEVNSLFQKDETIGKIGEVQLPRSYFNLNIRCGNRNQLGVTCRNQTGPESRPKLDLFPVHTTYHLTISIRGQCATGKIQRNNYHHGSCRPSLTGKTVSAFLIFRQGTHRNVKKSLSDK